MDDQWVICGLSMDGYDFSGGDEGIGSYTPTSHFTPFQPSPNIFCVQLYATVEGFEWLWMVQTPGWVWDRFAISDDA